MKTAKISIHAPRAGSDVRLYLFDRPGGEISIHAPRAGSDVRDGHRPDHGRGISIHAPRAGSDARNRVIPPIEWDFNPRSPCGERPTKRRTSSPSV